MLMAQNAQSYSLLPKVHIWNASMLDCIVSMGHQDLQQVFHDTTSVASTSGKLVTRTIHNVSAGNKQAVTKSFNQAGTWDAGAMSVEDQQDAKRASSGRVASFKDRSSAGSLVSEQQNSHSTAAQLSTETTVKAKVAGWGVDVEGSVASGSTSNTQLANASASALKKASQAHTLDQDMLQTAQENAAYLKTSQKVRHDSANTAQEDMLVSQAAYHLTINRDQGNDQAHGETRVYQQGVQVVTDNGNKRGVYTIRAVDVMADVKGFTLTTEGEAMEGKFDNMVVSDGAHYVVKPDATGASNTLTLVEGADPPLYVFTLAVIDGLAERDDISKEEGLKKLRRFFRYRTADVLALTEHHRKNIGYALAEVGLEATALPLPQEVVTSLPLPVPLPPQPAVRQLEISTLERRLGTMEGGLEDLKAQHLAAQLGLMQEPAVQEAAAVALASLSDQADRMMVAAVAFPHLVALLDPTVAPQVQEKAAWALATLVNYVDEDVKSGALESLANLMDQGHTQAVRDIAASVVEIISTNNYLS